ncbi:hypothetical protein GKE62_16235 [Novosphingobium sp. Gsoil 351]|nr:hypothetical protein GKE62_16235 [Novosphingobium sp. Gsoil 351]
MIESENRAWLGRVTCGWKKRELDLEDVLCYWRDVHSPSIARRPGIWEYRHFQFEAVRPGLLSPDAGIEFACPAGEQLMWTSDVRYASQAALDAFGAAPDPETRGHLLGDIELIVDQSTTYRVLEDLGRTYVDRSGQAAPQGAPARPTFSLFLRRRGDEAAFRALLGEVAARWAADPDVIRLRLSLFEAPDMEVERASGYPIKTHPPERQYQGWIDLIVTSEAALARLVREAGLSREVSVLHAYPVRAIYTSNRHGRPTFVGLRGFPAYAALTALGGYNQAHPSILRWMYGEVAEGVELEAAA